MSNFLKDFFASRPDTEKQNFIQSLVEGENNEAPDAGAESPEVVAEKTQETHMEDKELKALQAELQAAKEANDKIVADFAAFKQQFAVSAKEAIENESEDFSSDLIMSGHFAPSAKDGLKAFYAKLKDIEICTGDDAKIEGKTLTQCFADFFAKDGPADAARELAGDGKVANVQGMFLVGNNLGSVAGEQASMSDEEIGELAGSVVGKKKKNKNK